MSPLVLALLGACGGSAEPVVCDDACPEGMNRFEIDFTGTIPAGAMVVESSECLAYCEPVFQCRFPNVPEITEGVFTCRPLGGYATVQPIAEVDTSFGEAWRTLDPTWELPVGSPVVDLAVGDLDEDGQQDVVVLDYGVELGFGRVDGTLEPLVDAGLDTPLQQAVLIGEFTGDGHLDIGVVSGTLFDPDFELFVHAGDGAGGFGPGSSAGTGYSGTVFALDLDGDGLTDLVDGGVAPRVAFATGAGGFAIAPLPGGPWGYLEAALSPGDVDGDGLIDLAVSASGGGVYLQQPGRSFGAPITGLDGTDRLSPTGCLDTDGDGIDEILIWNPDEGSLDVYALGGGRIGAIPSSFPSFGVARGDLDGDGIGDRVDPAPALLASGGGEPWTGGRPGPLGAVAAPADLDGDGLYEIVVGSSASIAVVWP